MQPQEMSLSSRIRQKAARGARMGSILVLVVLGTILPGPAHAATIFFGPTAYRSNADSPFDLSGLGETFFLEDFEDGELNTPGIYQPVGRPAQGRVRVPSPTTDSVDADDGVLDGNGSAGHSMRGNTYTAIFTDPKQTFWDLFFAFDASRVGFLPNAFGFVWTDGPPESTVILSAYDANDVELGVGLFRDLGDDVNDGRTSEDRFFGIRSSIPIHRIRLSNSNRGETRPPEIDHVQYGLHVPEPSAGAILFFCGVSIWRVHFDPVSTAYRRHGCIHPPPDEQRRWSRGADYAGSHPCFAFQNFRDARTAGEQILYDHVIAEWVLALPGSTACRPSRSRGRVMVNW